MFDAIIANLSKKQNLTDEDRKELSELIRMTTQLTEYIRKEKENKDYDHNV